MRFLSLLLFVALLAGCADKVVPASKKAQHYAEQGEAFMQDGDYADAIAAWEKVRDSFYSPELNILAELKISEAYYLDEKYPEATAACELFLKNHPNHPDSATVFYRLGMSYFMQMLSADRDQTATRNAIVTFRNLLRRYPGFEQRAEVEQRIETARQRLAEHEVAVADFYLRTDKPLAAIKRFDYLQANYPNFVAPDDLYFDIGEALLNLGERGRALQIFELLKRHHPGSDHLAEVAELLQENPE